MDMITYVRAKKYADKAVATGGNTELIESMVTEEVTKVVAGADADFDTLKEVADWIKNDKTGAAKMQVDIGTLKTDLKNIELTPGPQGPQGDIGPQGPKGDPSKSAYEYAQDGGYTGTEEEFANDLHEVMNPTQVDWEQANENAIDYIKNKPFGETNEFEYVPLVENLTLATNTSGMLDKLPSIEYDNSYKIVVDGKEYFCEPVSVPVLGSSTPAIGNTSPISGGEWDSTQPPLYIGCISNFWMIGTANRENGDTTPYMVSVFKKQRIIKRLNLEYIQDIAGSQCHVQDFVYGDKTYNSYDGAEIFNSKDNVAIGFYSHAEGHDTIALGDYSHAEGSHCETVGYSSHAEGSGAQAIGNYSHAEGASTEASGDGSHAEGNTTVSSSTATHAEGYNTIANTPFLHVQGSYNIPEENPTLFGWGIWNTIGNKTYDGETVIYIYDEIPSLNKTTGIITAGEAREGTIKELKAENYFSFENQSNSVIEGVYCTREFIGTETNSETGITSYTWHLVMYKASPRNFDLCKYLHIVGNGDRDKRSNAHTLEADGTAWYQGDVYVGSTSGVNRDEGSKKLATEDYVNSSISTAKNELLNGAGEAYDTLKELGELINENQDAIEALETIAASKSDWNENDPSSSKYIENKPFGKSSEYNWVEILNNPSYTGFLNMLDFCPTFTLGATYKVTFNDSDYICTCKYSQLEGSNYLGATINFKEGTFIPGQDDDIPFCLLTADGQGLLTVRDSLPENFIIYEQQFLVNKLDEQFIPDTIARKEDIEKLVTKEQAVGKKTEGTVVTFEDKEYTCGVGAEIFNDLSANLAIGKNSHAEGSQTVAVGMNAHAEGWQSQAIGNFSHAENYSQASGAYGHSEGSQTIAKGTMSHAEGWMSEASGDHSHAEGQGTVALTSGSHVQGMYNKIDTDKGRTIYMPASSGLGNNKTFNKDDVVYVLEGDVQLNYFTGEITADSLKETLVKDLRVEDCFSTTNTNITEYYWLMNISEINETQLTGYCVTMTGVPHGNLGKYAHIVGNGGSAHARSNAHTLDWDGNAWYAGSVECTSFILKSSTEGSNKRFRVTIDDSGELHTEEIVE